MQDGAELVRYLENLARIALTPEERLRCQKDLTEIIGYYDTLNTLDTQGVAALPYAFPAANIYHADAVQSSLPPEEILANAPQKQDDCFLVPRTFDE
jgi:aspartyl-tRNA(Asn)/glutamyl-tRNA(Gln) amidotransferase subunit C